MNWRLLGSACLAVCLAASLVFLGTAPRSHPLCRTCPTVKSLVTGRIEAVKSVSAYRSYLTGNMYLSQGKPAVALECYRQAVREKPGMAVCYYKMAVAHRELNEDVECTNCYNRYVSLLPPEKRSEKLEMIVGKQQR